MSKGLAKKDVEKIVAAMRETAKAEENIAKKTKASVAKNLKNSGAKALAKKVAKIPLEDWKSLWSSFKEIFVQILRGVGKKIRRRLIEEISNKIFNSAYATLSGD